MQRTGTVHPKKTLSFLRRQESRRPWQRKCTTVYILASKRNGTLYIAVTGNLPGRVNQHRSGEIPGFTQRYAVHRLVYFETFRHVGDAIAREKQLKRCKRAWKLRLIEQNNPQWRDLYDELLG